MYFTHLYFTQNYCFAVTRLWEMVCPFESCQACLHQFLPCISSKPQTGTKRQLDSVEASEDIKPELTIKETEEVEPKKARLSRMESPTKVPVKTDTGTEHFCRYLFFTFWVLCFVKTKRIQLMKNIF